MDPLSITTAIIAVATLTKDITSTFLELKSFNEKLPGRLHALNNEIVDLETVVAEFASQSKKREALPDDYQVSVVRLLTLERARTKLLELQAILTRIRDLYRDATILTATKLFYTERGKLEELQEALISVKSDLNIMHGALRSQGITHVRLDLQAMAVSNDQRFTHVDDSVANIDQRFTHVDDRVANIEKLLKYQTDRLFERQYEQVGALYGVLAASRRGTFKPRARVENNNNNTQPTVGIQAVYTTSCRPGCLCACHSHHKLSSPRALNRVLGQFFMSYTGIPYLTPKCDDYACRGSRATSTVSMEYWMPLRFISSAILRIQAGYTKTGLLFHLQTLRSVPDDAQCVKLALNGNTEGLKYLFKNGLASPRDVSPGRGYTLLRWALYGKQYATCAFLIQEGADPDYRPLAASDNSPRIKASHFLLEGGLPETGVDALRLITKGGHHDDFIDESNFTTIHRIVLGLSLKSLEEELRLNPGDINAQDSMGRTPLAWAAARGDSYAVVTLLSYFADPNIMDVQLSGPLSNAAARGYTACVRLLLEAGARPDPLAGSGIKKGSPFNVAARNATDALLLKTLLDFGADPNSSGTDGDTALIHAARTDNSSFALLFLEYGANINTITATGATPLTTAITYNSHNVLRLILERWHEYSGCPRLNAPHLLEIVALYADVETLQTLAGMDHLRARHDKEYTMKDFNSRLRQRSDLTEELTVAFGRLLDIINEVPKLKQYSRNGPSSGLIGYPHKKVIMEFASEYDDQDSPSSQYFFSCPVSPADSVVSEKLKDENIQGEIYDQPPPYEGLGIFKAP